ncbi:hypothetical protein CP8484711_1850, partial [Chlamydia psittaci 84-8471/1]
MTARISCPGAIPEELATEPASTEIISTPLLSGVIPNFLAVSGLRFCTRIPTRFKAETPSS